ncbi:MAG TPA: lasso peptide biosynthesis B2 protein [Blastocatellia bacterium]|nr:lasso peptide biosynthesis B2 protein [Blastocatellia bacterium]
MQLFSRLRRFSSLPVAKQWRLLSALAGLTLTAAGLQVAGFRRVAAVLPRLAPAPRRALSESENHRCIRRDLGALQWATDRCPLEARCLARSLTLWWMLRCAGIEGVLRIGIRHEEGKFESHAWIEFQGRPLNDRLDVRDRFVVLESRRLGVANR